MKFIIVAPPYNHKSCGIRVLYQMNELLNHVGQESEVFNIFSIYREGDVVIYPEIVKGNPLHATRVIRYCLNLPGVLGGDKYFNKNELVIYYGDWIRQGAETATGKILDDCYKITISAIEPTLFFNDGKEKAGSIAYFGKGQACYPPLNEVVWITSSWPSDREELAFIMRGIKRVYSYDSKTALNAEALLCGAELFVAGALNWNREEYDVSIYKDPFFNMKQINKFISLVRERWNEI